MRTLPAAEERDRLMDEATRLAAVPAFDAVARPAGLPRSPPAADQGGQAVGSRAARRPGSGSRWGRARCATDARERLRGFPGGLRALRDAPRASRSRRSRGQSPAPARAPADRRGRRRARRARSSSTGSTTSRRSSRASSTRWPTPWPTGGRGDRHPAVGRGASRALRRLGPGPPPPPRARLRRGAPRGLPAQRGARAPARRDRPVRVAVRAARVRRRRRAGRCRAGRCRRGARRRGRPRGRGGGRRASGPGVVGRPGSSRAAGATSA